MSKQWGNVDRANASPIWATAYVNKTANSDNQTNLFNNATSGAFISGAAVGTFGVSPAEMVDNVAYAQVASVTVTSAGSGFTVRPTITFTNGGVSATGAAANVTAKVVAVTLGGGASAGGTGYANGQVVAVAGGTSSVAANVNILTTNSTGGVLTVSINAAGVYTALPTLANCVTTANAAGSGLKLDLSFGVAAATMTSNGTGYTQTPTVTFGGAGGTGATGIAALRSEQMKVTSAGWVLRKAFGNRVQYETLVAMKTITSDASDDTKLPE